MTGDWVNPRDPSQSRHRDLKLGRFEPSVTGVRSIYCGGRSNQRKIWGCWQLVGRNPGKAHFAGLDGVGLMIGLCAKAEFAVYVPITERQPNAIPGAQCCKYASLCDRLDSEA